MNEHVKPSDAAMKLAVEMEIHAALSTTTRAKAVEIDKAIAPLNAAIERMRDTLLAIESFAGNDPRCDRDAVLFRIYREAREALAETAPSPSHPKD